MSAVSGSVALVGAARTPFGRFGEPGDLPGAVIFLASEKASGFVTGACLAVDGGFLVDCI